MQLHTRRRAAVTGVAVSALLALTACGGDGGPGPTEGTGASSSTSSSTSTSEPSSTSTSEPSSTSTSKTSSKTSTSTDPTTSSSTSTDTGEPFDAAEFTDRIEQAVAANPSVRIEVSLGDGGSAGTAQGVQDLEDDSLEMDVTVGGQQLSYRLVDGTYYLAQGSKWIEVTEGSSNPLVQQALGQTELLSMRRQLDAFVAGVESAGDKGTEDVDGVSTTHYTATVDTDKAFAELGLPTDAGTPESVIYDVWLDEDDLIRKMSFTQNGANATLTASDWGEPVDISAPDDSELVPVG